MSEKIERRKHGCDGCNLQVPTERFDGYCGNYLWLCNTCINELIKHGLTFTIYRKQNKD